MSGDLETYLGAPANPMARMFTSPAGGQKPGAPGARLRVSNPEVRNLQELRLLLRHHLRVRVSPQRTPEQEAAIAKYNQDLKQWRISLPMSKVEGAKKLFDEAGIKIHIVKFSPADGLMKKLIIPSEQPKPWEQRRMRRNRRRCRKKNGTLCRKTRDVCSFPQPYAICHSGFSYDPFLAVSPAVMMNFDAGHFFGSTGIHPNTIIEKYHDRIFTVHLKDKTGPKTDPANTNQVWGQGEVPIADVLLLIKKKLWPIFVDIELEYDIKPWSNAVKETKTCVEYARQILI
jgi:hypothetical protein